MGKVQKCGNLVHLYSLGGECWCGFDDLIVFLLSYVVMPETLKLPEGKHV